MEEFDKEYGNDKHEPNFKKCDCEMGNSTLGDDMHDDIMAIETIRYHHKQFLFEALQSLLLEAERLMPEEPEPNPLDYAFEINDSINRRKTIMDCKQVLRDMSKE
jgi:hypothetical protein